MIRCTIMGPVQSGKSQLIAKISNKPINDKLIIGIEIVQAKIVVDNMNYDVSLFDSSGSIRFLDMMNLHINASTVFVVIINDYNKNLDFYKKLCTLLKDNLHKVIFVTGINTKRDEVYELFNIEHNDMIHINNLQEIKKAIVKS